MYIYKEVLKSSHIDQEGITKKLTLSPFFLLSLITLSDTSFSFPFESGKYILICIAYVEQVMSTNKSC